MRFQHTATEGIFVQIKCSKKTQTGKTVTAPWWPVNLKDLRVLLSHSGKYCKEYFLSTHDTPKKKFSAQVTYFCLTTRLLHTLMNHQIQHCIVLLTIAYWLHYKSPSFFIFKVFSSQCQILIDFFLLNNIDGAFLRFSIRFNEKL